MEPPRKPSWGLCRRRQCLVPTWRGWALLLLGFGLVMVLAVREAHPLLALNDPVPGGVLVVEGWAGPEVLEAAVAEFKRNHYATLFVTGGPLEQGAALSEYHTYAELGAAGLVKLGLSTNEVQAVPAPRMDQDRIYASASSLARWLRGHGTAPTRVNLIAVGVHARRARLLFQQALGKGVTVGVIAMPERGYDASRWWRSSQGVRAVLGEALSYGYALVF